MHIAANLYPVGFSWVRAHSGLVHNEIADTLATRGVNGSSYCPLNRFDVLPADAEPEDVFDAQNAGRSSRKLTNGTKTFICHRSVHERPFSDLAEVTFNRFSRDVLGNWSAIVSDDSDVPQGEHIPVMTGGMRVVSDEEQEESAPEVVTLPTIEFKPWSGNWTWPQALEADRREMAERLAFQQELG
jgi:hypothetical protein